MEPHKAVDLVVMVLLGLGAQLVILEPLIHGLYSLSGAMEFSPLDWSLDSSGRGGCLLVSECSSLVF